MPLVFVNAERGNFTAVYDVSNPRRPVFRQLLPTTNGPEGVVAVPSRGLLVVSSEEEIPDANIRWLASETPNLLVRLDGKGRVQQEIGLPADVAAAVTANGFEGVAEIGGALWVAIQRPLRTDPATVARIGRYDLGTGTWSSLAYPLDAAPAGWTGLPTVRKRLVADLLPALRADRGWVQDKVEGLAIGGDGRTYAVTDNDAVDDATGETAFLRLGHLL